MTAVGAFHEVWWRLQSRRIAIWRVGFGLVLVFNLLNFIQHRIRFLVIEGETNRFLLLSLEVLIKKILDIFSGCYFPRCLTQPIFQIEPLWCSCHQHINDLDVSLASSDMEWGTTHAGDIYFFHFERAFYHEHSNDFVQAALDRNLEWRPVIFAKDVRIDTTFLKQKLRNLCISRANGCMKAIEAR